MVTEESRSIGHRIGTARQEKGLSAEKLAQKAGCSDEYLEWVENGQVEPPVALLLQLAKSYELPVMTTKYSLFVACGRLYMNGLRGMDGSW